jgi:DUF917 family protein
VNTFNRNDLEYIIRGACFLGSGGGGSYTTAIGFAANFKKEIYTVDEVKVASIASLTEKKAGIMVAYMGAPEAMTVEPMPFITIEAVKKVQELKGVTIEYIVPAETGPLNMTIACLTAAALNVSVVNADGAGRAVPTLELLTYAGKGLSVNPTVLTGELPDKQNQFSHLILNISDDTGEGAPGKIEALARPTLAMSEYHERAGLAMWYMEDISILKNPGMCIPGTLSACRDIGVNVYEQQMSDTPDYADIFGLLISQGRHAVPLCKGVLKSAEIVTSGGFDKGVIGIDGKIDGKEAKVTILFQNESLIAWDSIHAKPLAMAPDTITYVIVEKGGGASGAEVKRQWVYTNGDIMDANGLKKELQDAEIQVIGIQACSPLRDSKKLAYYMDVLNTFGYYGGYFPVEQ